MYDFLKIFQGYWSADVSSVVLVSGAQRSDSVMHIHIFILFQILFSCRLSQSSEWSSLQVLVGHLSYI